MNTHSPPSEQDHFDAAKSFQEYYDTALREVGVRIPAPVLGQSANDYRRKTLAALQRALLPHHQLGKVDFHELKADALQVVEPQALDACKTERMNPRNVPPGQIVPRKSFDQYGRVQQTTYIGGQLPNGEQTCFVTDLTRPGRRVVSFSAEGRVFDATKGSWR
jgi:hypothetical protein